MADDDAYMHGLICIRVDESIEGVVGVEVGVGVGVVWTWVVAQSRESMQK